MTWDQFKSQVTIPFLLDLLVQGSAWYTIHKVAGQPVTAPPTVTDPTNLQQIGRVAIHSVVVGKKRSQRDEAIFSSLVNDSRITPLQRSIIDDMLDLPLSVITEAQKKDFRYTVACMQQLTSVDATIAVLQAIGDQPTPEDALAKARSEGLLEPEDPTKVQMQMEAFLQKVGAAAKAAWQRAEASAQQSGVHNTAQKLFEGQLNELFKK